MRSTFVPVSVVLVSTLIACNKDKATSPEGAAPVAAKAADEAVPSGPKPAGEAAPAARPAPPPRELLRLTVEKDEPRRSETDETVSDLRQVLTFDDASGENRIEITIASDPFDRGDEPPGKVSRRFELVHHATKDGETRELRAVRDSVVDCQHQAILWLAGEVKLSDADSDGTGEVLFSYQIGCRKNPKPNDLKVMLLEGGQKYIYRGQTHVYFEEGKAGGKIASKEPADMPVAFARLLQERWGEDEGDMQLTGDSDGMYSKKDVLY